MSKTYYTVEGQVWGEHRSGESDSRDYLHDALGNVVAVFQNGWEIAEAFYKPHGEFAGQWNFVAHGYRFAWVGAHGYRRTNMVYITHYVRARHYSQIGANWTTRDPLWPREMPYGYVSGRVMRASDYTGLEPSRMAPPGYYWDCYPGYDDRCTLRKSPLRKRTTSKSLKDIVRDSLHSLMYSCYPDQVCLNCCQNARKRAGASESPYIDSLRRNFRLTGQGGNGVLNAISHCHSACLAAKICGPSCADKYLNEFYEGIDPRNTDFYNMDKHNNTWGFSIASNQSSDPNYAGGSCLQGCVHAYNIGLLTVDKIDEQDLVLPKPNPSGNVWQL